MITEAYTRGYNNLNSKQKEAVDTIEGPVMVVAGPGTGKTQVLTLRIANILVQTDTKADGILCLTFTNSGVRAMRERLFGLIGGTAAGVTIQTFHSFAGACLEEWYEAIGLPAAPTLLNDKDAIVLVDELLENNEWEYLRPRGGGAHNFKDLKSLFSLLKREKLAPDDFKLAIEQEIKSIQTDPASVSSRGDTKGKLKKEIQEKVLRLERTSEAADFYQLYEATKRNRNLADYDDIVAYLVELVGTSAEARDSIRERYLYVLVDEHQDSSGVQNEFLKLVWGDTEKPNLFVVGDDRQLIYAFGGATIEHFENFTNNFNDTKLIALTDNYRSTQTILDTAHQLLESSIVADKLKSHRKADEPVRLVEAEYPRDEILAAGLAIKEQIATGGGAEDWAVLMPKNSQVRSALAVLTDMGLPVAAGDKLNLWTLSETYTLLNLLRVLVDPNNKVALAALILDPLFKIPLLTAHTYVRSQNRKLSLGAMAEERDEVGDLGRALIELLDYNQKNGVYRLTQELAKRFLFTGVDDNEVLLKRIEITRTILHLILTRLEREPRLTLESFVVFINRLETYEEAISLDIFNATKGVQVKTIHNSKGLEFNSVWIAHLDEKSLMKGKQNGFTLPASLKDKVAAKDVLTAKRELYVAMTRARQSLMLSYAKNSYAGTDQALATIVAELPDGTLEKVRAEATEAKLLAYNPKLYAAATPLPHERAGVEQIKELVRAHYSDAKVAVTHLNNFFSCPWKWYFKNFLQLPEPEAESLQFGSLVHAGAEAILKNQEITETDLAQVLGAKLDQMYVFDEKERARMLKPANEALSNFKRTYLPGMAKDIQTEANKVYRDADIPNLQVTGKIDLVETTGPKKFQVTDFKTGKVKTNKEIEKIDDGGRLSDHLRQLAMYSYLLRTEGEVENSRLLFLEAKTGDHNALYQTTIGNEQIELLRQDLKDFDRLLTSGEWVDCACGNDKFGQPCEYCALRDVLIKK